MLSLTAPVGPENADQLRREILGVEKGFSRHLSDTLLQMLDLVPEKRPTAEELVDMLQAD